MRDELHRDPLQFDVPNRAGSVYGACANDGLVLLIPIKTRDRGAVERVPVSQHLVLLVGHRVFLDLPNAQIFSSGGQNVLARPFDIRNPHDLRRWKFMLKLIDLLKAVIRLAKIEIHNVDLVVDGVGEIACYRHSELVVFSISESNGIILELALIGVYLLGEALLLQEVNIVPERPILPHLFVLQVALHLVDVLHALEVLDLHLGNICRLPSSIMLVDQALNLNSLVAILRESVPRRKHLLKLQFFCLILVLVLYRLSPSDLCILLEQ